ncbi:hypothetical protein C8J57DRAFT_1385379, partial [Mycena rebaudengoi]
MFESGCLGILCPYQIDSTDSSSSERRVIQQSMSRFRLGATRLLHSVVPELPDALSCSPIAERVVSAHGPPCHSRKKLRQRQLVLLQVIVVACRTRGRGLCCGVRGLMRQTFKIPEHCSLSFFGRTAFWEREAFDVPVGSRFHLASVCSFLL